MSLLEIQIYVCHIRGYSWERQIRKFCRHSIGSKRGNTPPTLAAPYVAPFIEVKPRKRVGITVHNKLPADRSCVGNETKPH
jgi:hypothetical protein